MRREFSSATLRGSNGARLAGHRYKYLSARANIQDTVVRSIQSHIHCDRDRAVLIARMSDDLVYRQSAEVMITASDTKSAREKRWVKSAALAGA